ncbi:ABC transporter ATP-binding protein [Sulfolobus sp. A20]|uniref:ABC transporter ATP-binding protein n=1 Tax=Sulfolobaceae TaxID=118883 RepID=UPI000845C71B|nr:MULTISPECIES: ABC transporter ATP-binding protein [unclassified Sulfolobus]TRM77298.1 ABC transporter ATP-binding protein [Sulfolobus sp. A20-N-F8]TRM81393.1 ABC transporter ATP-binding protein [Sulfolobus sp. D5]TRM84777.1 ABC transporter ATP-binding protein [Sulfolobus sp. F3]TRM86747.1 ABC transporter ATP-binding protein [Sulfolobus sp. C3]TRM98339.1 ABC transporter ATP-binding protein [Sulfolobus sp. E1]
MDEVSISVKNLSVGYLSDYGLIRVLRNVSIDIPRNKITGIAGESGSGKSTLATAVMGFVSPPMIVESGDVIINEKYKIFNLDDIELNQIRGKIISYVPQAAQNSLNPIRKVKETFADILKSKGMDYYNNLSMIYKALEDVGLSDKQILDMYPFQLSGGMKQRVVIAISLLLNPEIVIMDEPTTGLDVVVQYEILRLIKKLQKERNLTLVIISHDIAMLFQISDYIAVMYGGQIVEYGKYNTLLEEAYHPYTYLLLNSIPTIRARGKKLPRISGDFEGFIRYPKGCVFSYRCPFATITCKDSQPETVKYDSFGYYKCHRYPEWRNEVKKAYE